MTARDRTVVVVVAVVVALAASWLLLIGPKRSQASKLGEQIKAAQSQLDSARSSLASNQAARATFARNYSVLVRLGEAVPADDNVPSLIYQLQSAATAARVDFRDLTLNPAAAGSAPAPTPPPGTPGSAGSSSGSSATSALATQAAAASLPPGAAVGPAGFPAEPFTFTFRGNFFHLADFLGRVERFVVANNKGVSVSGRLMTLNGISLGPGPKGFPQIQASIAATTFIVPAAQGILNGASATAPAPATGQSVSTTSAAPTTAPTAAITSPVR
jgi:type II secretory pathway pseudopilin PulG